MTETPYAPPGADLARPQRNAPLFAVSPAKLAILSLTTLTAYQFWWQYKNWSAIRARGIALSPFWRAFFGQFFAYSLFARLDGLGAGYALRVALGPAACGVAYLLMWLVSTLPPPWYLLAQLSFLPLMPANSLARALNERDSPGAEAIVGWSRLNVAWALLAGVPLIGLVLFGAFG